MQPPELPAELKPSFDKLVSSGDSRRPEELRIATKVHLQRVAQAAKNPALKFDPRVAEAIGKGLLELLETPVETPQKSWVHAAVCYYVNMDDQEPDFESPDGFTDDAQFFNAVARALGRNDLLVSV